MGYIDENENYDAGKADLSPFGKEYVPEEETAKEIKPHGHPPSSSDEKEPIKVTKSKRILNSVKQFFADVLNGLVIALSMFTAAGLIIESYIEPPYQNFIWLAFIPFGIVIYYLRSAFTSALFGLGMGIITYMGILSWIFITVFEGTGNQNLSLLSVFSLSCVLALQFALFAWACFYLKRAKLFFPLSAACAWTALEFLHELISYKFLGFFWFSLGYTQYANLPLIQISSITGVYGVSFLIVFTSLCAAYIITKNKKSAKIFYALSPLLLITGIAFYGANQINLWQEYERTNPAQLSVALMQPNTHKMLLDGRLEDVEYTIAEQALSLEDKKLDLVIWPESSLPGTFQKDFFNTFAKETSQKGSFSQIFGSYSEKDGKEYVSAALIDAGGVKDIYDKVKLVPFGEFLPFYSSFKGLYDANKISSFTGTFKEGAQPAKVFDLVLRQGTTEQAALVYRIGPTICFESLFPQIWIDKAKNGAAFFVNISNDGWFGDTAAPYQHLRILTLRAVETRRPVLRSANTGLSGWIDSTGKIRMRTNLNERSAAVFNFTFPPQPRTSVYVKFGPVFALACLAAAALFTAVCALFLTEENN